jgi:hypothetical protein
VTKLNDEHRSMLIRISTSAVYFALIIKVGAYSSHFWQPSLLLARPIFGHCKHVMGVIGPLSFLYLSLLDQIVPPVCLVICNSGRCFAYHLMLIKLNEYSADP